MTPMEVIMQHKNFGFIFNRAENTWWWKCYDCGVESKQYTTPAEADVSMNKHKAYALNKQESSWKSPSADVETNTLRNKLSAAIGMWSSTDRNMAEIKKVERISINAFRLLKKLKKVYKIEERK
jgi:hypothetical protein